MSRALPERAEPGYGGESRLGALQRNPLEGNAHLLPKYRHDLATASNCAAIKLGGVSRLARTLEGNEKRYQRMLVERELLIEKSGGKQIVAFPGEYVFLAVPHTEAAVPGTSSFQHFRVPSNVSRKWVCGLDRVLQHQPNPIIYALNDKTPAYSSFEQDIIERSPGCQIYAFDANAVPEIASQWPWGTTDVAADLLWSRVQFNHYAISDPSAKQYRSLRSVMREFGHDWIDILKVHLSLSVFLFLLQCRAQSSEFDTLLAILADNKDAPLPFGQLIIKLHVGLSERMKTVEHFSAWFTKLECAGLRPYYFEVNMLDVNNRRAEPSVAYWSLMNIRGRHALVNDGLPELLRTGSRTTCVRNNILRLVVPAAAKQAKSILISVQSIQHLTDNPADCHPQAGVSPICSTTADVFQPKILSE
ncbi:hypothetical protein B0H13DRAFT_1875100 [Mycena leptocephala]|nr:hypothetical protein B0H13DRAFT_1875100 [Mycena leptocephala]